MRDKEAWGTIGKRIGPVECAARVVWARDSGEEGEGVAGW